MRECISCKKSKEENEFHKKGNGFQSNCKLCMKEYTKARYLKKKEHILSLARQYKQSEKGKNIQNACQNRTKAKYPEKRQARIKVTNAIRLGKLIKQPCEKCGKEKAEAHHDDYSKPLDIRWLCSFHHKQLHSLTTNK